MPWRVSDQPMSRSERRRSPRVPILLKVSAAVAGESPLSGEITDFCDEGAFLRLAGGRMALRARNRWIGRAIDLRFAASHLPGHPTLRLGGKIVRICETGVGLAFDDPDAAEALEALRKIARAAETPIPHGRPPELEQACRQALESVIPEIMRSFFERIPTDLLDAAERAESSLHQTAYYDAVAIFRNSREISEKFHAEVLRQTERYDVADDPQPDSRPAKTLSLLETEPFEDWLNLVGEATKLEAAFAEPLRTLNRRLSRSPTATNDGKTPYGPLALGRAFRKVTEDLPLANAARRVAYRTLGHVLSKTAGPLYGQLLKLTAPLESIDPPQKVRNSARPDARKGKGAGEASADADRTKLEAAPVGSAGIAGADAPNLSSTFAALNRLNAASNTKMAVSRAQPTEAQPTDWGQAVASASEQSP